MGVSRPSGRKVDELIPILAVYSYQPVVGTGYWDIGVETAEGAAVDGAAEMDGGYEVVLNVGIALADLEGNAVGTAVIDLEGDAVGLVVGGGEMLATRYMSGYP